MSKDRITVLASGELMVEGAQAHRVYFSVTKESIVLAARLGVAIRGVEIVLENGGKQ